MTIALLDADVVAFRCAASCTSGEPAEIACLRADKLIRSILEETNSSEYKAYLSGSHNFRYDIYPDYKANRKGKPRPEHLQAVREFLVKEWNAEVSDGIEADDSLGIAASNESVICSIDKDLLQIPGEHFNFVRGERSSVGEVDGLRAFYCQVILGDKSDNIPGYDGMARVKVPNFLKNDYYEIYNLEDELDMYHHVLGLYGGDQETMHRNAKLLYILRKENEFWQPPNERK